jgi:hypothetical protein
MVKETQPVCIHLSFSKRASTRKLEQVISTGVHSKQHKEKGVNKNPEFHSDFFLFKTTAIFKYLVFKSLKLTATAQPLSFKQKQCFAQDQPHKLKELQQFSKSILGVNLQIVELKFEAQLNPVDHAQEYSSSQIFM